MRNLALLAALFCLSSAARANWSVVSTARETSPAAPQVEHLTTRVADSETGEEARLEIAMFSNKGATLRVIDQGDGSGSNLAEVMQKEHGVAGTNGGYFDPEAKPVGLLVSDGRLLAPLRKARLLSGVLSVSKAGVRLLRTAEYATKRDDTQALQCGPFLVDGGRAVAGLEATRAARRSFVAIAPNDRVALGYCSNATLAQLARILSTPGAIGEAKATRALNLDGGSSSAFWFAGKDGAVSVPEQKTVRNFVAVVAK